jgi:hypothetical protein
LHTRLAAYTPIIVEINNPVITGKQSIGGADGCTRCVLTMVASMHTEFSGGIRIGAGLDVLDVGSIDADGHIVLGLTSDSAGMTTDAGPIVDDESIVDHRVTSGLQG